MTWIHLCIQLCPALVTASLGKLWSTMCGPSDLPLSSRACHFVSAGMPLLSPGAGGSLSHPYLQVNWSPRGEDWPSQVIANDNEMFTSSWGAGIVKQGCAPNEWGCDHWKRVVFFLYLPKSECLHSWGYAWFNSQCLKITDEVEISGHTEMYRPVRLCLMTF